MVSRQEVEARAEQRAAEIAEAVVRLAEDRAKQEVVECQEIVTEAVGHAEKAKEAEVRQQLAHTEVRNISQTTLATSRSHLASQRLCATHRAAHV